MPAFASLLALARTFRATCEDRLSLLREEEADWRGEDELRDMIANYESLHDRCEKVIADAERSC